MTPTLTGRRPFERRQGRTAPEAIDIGDAPPARPILDNGLNDMPEPEPTEPKPEEPQP